MVPSHAVEAEADKVRGDRAVACGVRSTAALDEHEALLINASSGPRDVMARVMLLRSGGGPCLRARNMGMSAGLQHRVPRRRVVHHRTGVYRGRAPGVRHEA